MCGTSLGLLLGLRVDLQWTSTRRVLDLLVGLHLTSTRRLLNLSWTSDPRLDFCWPQLGPLLGGLTELTLGAWELATVEIRARQNLKTFSFGI